MYKVRLLAIAAAVILLAGIGGWVSSYGRVKTSLAPRGIDSSELTTSTMDPPVESFVDYSFVY
jgi:hypothetical protein